MYVRPAANLVPPPQPVLEQIAYIAPARSFRALGDALGGGRSVDDPAFVRLAGGVPHLTIDEVVAHPRMAEARRLYVDRFLAIYGDDPFMARLLIETGRFLVFLVAVVLAAGHDPARRETWFTVGRLKREMAVFGLASERQIDHLVGRLCAVGFMTSEPAEGDRRVRILRPTKRCWRTTAPGWRPTMRR